MATSRRLRPESCLRRARAGRPCWPWPTEPARIQATARWTSRERWVMRQLASTNGPTPSSPGVSILSFQHKPGCQPLRQWSQRDHRRLDQGHLALLGSTSIHLEASAAPGRAWALAADGPCRRDSAKPRPCCLDWTVAFRKRALMQFPVCSACRKTNDPSRRSLRRIAEIAGSPEQDQMLNSGRPIRDSCLKESPNRAAVASRSTKNRYSPISR